MNHTPGPWHFVPSSDARIPDRITNAAGSNIVSGSIGFDPDARLIAAAPDLLAAVARALQWCEEHGDTRHKWYADARAAIARAEGEA